jgi:hypothetical protein
MPRSLHRPSSLSWRAMASERIPRASSSCACRRTSSLRSSGKKTRASSEHLGVHLGLDLIFVAAHVEDSVRGTLPHSGAGQPASASALAQKRNQPTLEIRKMDPSGARSFASTRFVRGSNGVKSSCENLLSFSRFFGPSGSEHSPLSCHSHQVNITFCCFGTKTCLGEFEACNQNHVVERITRRFLPFGRKCCLFIQNQQ